MRFPGMSNHIAPEVLSEHADKRLDARESGKVEAHVSSCARCREEMEGLRATKLLLSRVPLRQPMRSFVFTAPPTTQAAPGRAKSTRAPLWAMPAAAAASLALFIGIFSADLSGAFRPEPVSLSGPSGFSQEQARQSTSNDSTAEGTPDAAPPAAAGFAPEAMPTPARAGLSPTDEPMLTMSTDGPASTPAPEGDSTGARAPEKSSLTTATDSPSIAASEDAAQLRASLGLEQPTPMWVRALEAALAAMAVGLGVTSVALMRRARG